MSQCLFKWLFKPPLYSQLVRIHHTLQHGRSLSVRLQHHLITLLSSTIILRMLAVSASLFYKSDLYFRYDLINRIIFIDSGLNDHYFALFSAFLPLFALNLFQHIHVHPDERIWAPLYDLVVRNRNQSYCIFNWAAFPRILSIQIPPNSRLLVFPRLSRQHRRRTLAIRLVFEVFTYGALAGCILLMIAVYFYVSRNQPWHWVLLIALDCTYFTYIGYQGICSCLLIMATIFLLLDVYAMQYNRLNTKLTAVLKSKTASSLRRIYRTTASYRAQHVQLTTFMLYYNDTLVAPIFARFRACFVPFHAYSVVLLYFDADLDPYITLQLQFMVIIFSCIPWIINTIIVPTNQAISNSAKHLLGILLATAQNHTIGWNAEGYLREDIKLRTYYELLWRARKRLGYTVGDGGPFIDFKLALDGTIQYFVYVLYFGAKFIAKKDDFIS